MRRLIVGIAVVALLVTGGYTVYAVDKCRGSGTSSAQAEAVSGTCRSDHSTASCEAPQGKIVGHFDAAMSGVCRFACATKLKYKSADVLEQPGALAGKLTQCPVSGVVFAVDASRPRVRIAGNDYVACCDRCATKLKRDPRHYLKA